MADDINASIAGILGAGISAAFAIGILRILSDTVNPRTGYREIVYIGKDGRRHKKIVRVQRRGVFPSF